MRELNGFWLFVSSCLPGCGQMYQGYMKRGASLLALFWVTVAVTSILRLDNLGVLIAAIWLYAFFDSYNLRALCKEGRALPDAYLFGGDDDGLRIFKGKGRKILGWTLVGVGAYALLEMVADTFANEYGWTELSYVMGGIVPKAVLTVLIICLGVWFIRGPKQPAESTDSFERYHPTESTIDPPVKKEDEGHE